MVVQTNFSNVLAILQHIYFNQQSEKILQKKFKIFLVNWSITDGNSCFEVPTQPSKMTDDTVRLVSVYTCQC